MMMSFAELQALSVANRAAGLELSREEKEAAIKATTVKGMRVLKTGKIEVTVQHELLPGGKRTKNFDCPYEGAAFKLLALDQLSRGVVPEVFRPEGGGESPANSAPATFPQETVALAISTRLRATNINLKRHDRDTLLTLSRELGATPLADITKEWGEDWVRKMKAKGVTPGTIRKKKEALQRAVNTYLASVFVNPKDRPHCALADLDSEYSVYNRHDGKIVEDGERYIRLPVGKEDEIEALLKGDYWIIPKKSGQGVYRGPYRCEDPEDLLIAFKLLLWTGVRMPELWQLQLGDIDLQRCKLNLHKSRTKKGYARPVPLRGWLARELGQYITKKHGAAVNSSAELLPFLKLPKNRPLTIDEREDFIERCGARMSNRFRSLFDAVGLEDYWPRDLRHEGISRMVEWKKPDGSLMFPRVEAIMEFSGHQSMAMFRIYWNMREHDFSDQQEEVSFA